MRLIVCGGRDYQNTTVIFGSLNRIHNLMPIKLLIEGGATGADRLASAWAVANKIETLRFEADWRQLGPAAGPIRNRRMLNKGNPDAVLAFPGGKGTENMCQIARKADVPVFKVSDSGSFDACELVNQVLNSKVSIINFRPRYDL